MITVAAGALTRRLRARVFGAGLPLRRLLWLRLFTLLPGCALALRLRSLLGGLRFGVARDFSHHAEGVEPGVADELLPAAADEGADVPLTLS
jgi:hypothetical protein